MTTIMEKMMNKICAILNSFAFLIMLANLVQGIHPPLVVILGLGNLLLAGIFWTRVIHEGKDDNSNDSTKIN
jgi:hypothetical protein